LLAGVLFEDLTQEIIGAAMEVHRTLGPGFLESIYRNALLQELQQRNVWLQAERDVPVLYKNHLVGRHRLDLVVENRVIVELKAISGISDVHFAQVLSYLKATNLHLALILNFGGPRLTWKRLAKTHKKSA
jgi:GxxExxY protein